MARPGLRSLSKARIITVMLLAGLMGLPAVPDQDQGQDVKTLIEDIKKTDRGRELLKSHSETDLEKMILFSRDPKKYFPDIQDIKDWCFYLAFYDDYIRLDLKSSYSLWFSWAGEKFTKADDDTAAILGFLLLNGRACGHLGEELADIYTALFRENPIPFMRDLEKRADWRPLVDSLSSGNWGEFRAGVAKIGDSMFEKEFRGYLAFEGSPEIPDELIQSAYTESAVKNVLAAVNPKVFPGYWSVCADGQGFGYGYTYPSLDGHQITDALLWLGQIDVVKANWAYVRSFQSADGSLPIAILPDLAGKQAGEGEHLARVAENGGLYTHWVPGNPLQALADPTFIQNADDIFRMTLDRNWLEAELPAVNLSAEHLASLVTDEGRVKGAGYYSEMPARVESDGVAQCHAIDAFRRVAALDRVAGDHATAKRFEALAERVRSFLVNRFWVAEKGQFAEYWHPEKGFISSHGLTDTDWAAIALDVATPEQTAVLWPKLANEPRFHYGGMPTGIATLPATYEDWEFTHPRRHDLAAMGRVWYLEAQARARMGDPHGLLEGLLKVAGVGRANGFFWRERYQPDSKGGVLAAGPNTYCEYPANLIRIVQRFLLGIDLNLDGSVTLAPSAIQGWWQKGFGQTLRWRSRSLQYEMKADRVFGTYQGDGPQTLRVRLPGLVATDKIRAEVRDLPAEAKVEDGVIIIHLARSLGQIPCRFEIVRKAGR